MKAFTTEIEILVILLLIVIAIVAGFFQRKRRAKRKAMMEKEQEIQASVRAKRKAHEQKESLPREETVAKKEPVVKKETVIKKEVVKVFGTHVPEDSMLRRHYITHLHSLIASLTGPRPTDSALKRHYDTHIESELDRALEDPAFARRVVINHEEQFRKAAESKIPQPGSLDAQLKAELAIEETVEPAAPAPEEIETLGAHVPQDSMLKRHYITHLRSMIESQPGNNSGAAIESELNKCLQDEAHVQRLVKDYETAKKKLKKIAPAAAKVKKTTKPNKKKGHTIKMKIPQDSMLRRHFITHLRSMIESAKGPRPTDSTLRRHYDTMIDSELRQQLENLQS